MEREVKCEIGNITEVLENDKLKYGARITVCNADYPKGYRNSVRESVLEAEEFWANNRNIVLSNKRSYEC